MVTVAGLPLTEYARFVCTVRTAASSPSMRSSRIGVTASVSEFEPNGNVTALVRATQSTPLLAMPEMASSTIISFVSPVRVRVNSPATGPSSFASARLADTLT